jgi:hypothetical protein
MASAVKYYFMKVMILVFLASLFMANTDTDKGSPDLCEPLPLAHDLTDSLQIELVWKGDGESTANLDLYLLHRVVFEGQHISYFELLEESENKSGFEKILWKVAKRPDRYFVAVNYRNGFNPARYNLVISDRNSQVTKFADTFTFDDRYSVKFYGPIEVNDRGVDLSGLTKLESTANH